MYRFQGVPDGSSALRNSCRRLARKYPESRVPGHVERPSGHGCARTLDGVPETGDTERSTGPLCRLIEGEGPTAPTGGG